MKPSGIAFEFNNNGDPTFRVTRSSRAEDLIWEAARAAIDEGLSPQHFRTESANAWEQILKDDARCAGDVLSRK